MLRVALLFLAFTAGAWAQCGLLVPNPTTGRLDCAGGAALVSGASLPATCSVGQVFFLTVGSVGGYQCVASNTWSAFTAGPSTIQYGAVYQAYSAGATTVTITHNFGQIQHAESNCVDTTTGFYLGGASSVAPGANADIIVFSVAAPHDGYCVINDPRFAAGSSYWSRTSGVLSPTTATDSLAIGATVTVDPAVGITLTGSKKFIGDGSLLTNLPASSPPLDRTFLGVCQNSVASWALNWGTSSTPTPTCHAGSNMGAYATLDFADSGTPVAYGEVEMPTASVPTIAATITTSASTGTSQSMTMRLYTACVASGASPDPSWNASQSFAITSSGTGGNEVDTTIASVTSTGCLAGNRLLLKLDRDTSDTSTATVQVYRLRITGS